MAGLIDPQAELDRLDKRLRRAETELGKLQSKLANGDFAKNAPPDVVAKDRARLSELGAEIDQLTQQVARVNALLGRHRDAGPGESVG
jgi:valyl-tRNA synthetase